MPKLFSKIKIPCWLIVAGFILSYCAVERHYRSADLEFSGYCPMDGKTYTHQEIADRAIAKIMESQHKDFPYKTPEELYARNPDCCQFYTWVSPEEVSLGEQRLARYLLGDDTQGGYIYQLTIYYRNGKYGDKPVNTLAYAIDACSRILEVSKTGVVSHPVQLIYGYPY